MALNFFEEIIREIVILYVGELARQANDSQVKVIISDGTLIQNAAKAAENAPCVEVSYRCKCCRSRIYF